MADQKFNASKREALWLAHEKKCAYTRELLDVSSCHIDHVIPEILAADPAEFQKIREKYQLPDDFDLFGFENLLPCKAGANLQKGALILEPARVHFFLAIAASKKPIVEENLRRIEKRQSGGRALVLLQQCLERGDLSAKEVADILEEHAEHPQEIFRLIEAMKFADATEISVVSKADIGQLRRRPVRLGANTSIDGVTLTKDSGEEILVKTCEQYDSALKAGYFALTNFDIKMSVFFEHQCGLLTALEAATTPERSFISDPRAGITDLHLLPFSLFPNIGEGRNEDGTHTYQSKVEEGTLIVRRLRQNALVVEEPEGMGQQLIEVARADFDSDGNEDILLFEYCYATHGTLGFGGITIITRKKPDGMFERTIPCGPYTVTSCASGALSALEIERCVSIVTSGEAVDPQSAARELPRASVLVVVRTGGEIVGVGAIKRIRTGYAEGVAQKSGFAFGSSTPELGYVAIDDKHRGKRLSHRIIAALLTEHVGPLFATTDNEHMKRTLAAAAFIRKGREWRGNRGELSLWLRD